MSIFRAKGKSAKKLWSESGVPVESLQIEVASDIFTLQKRAYLKNGRVVIEGTQYFTWSTACDLISEGHVDKGWRMPTFSEAEAIRDYYNKPGKGLLTLGLNGFITPSDMVAYNYLPKDCKKFVAQRGIMGYYWINDLDKPLYPHVITNTGMNIQVGGSIYLSYGIPMLLVRSL